MTEGIIKKLQSLPQKPGVYMFKNAKGLLLYVGKAVKLKNRVASYFRRDAGVNSPRIRSMISQIADLDYTVTTNELESLILENNFIKQYKPRYNVTLRDDKNYLFLKINVQDEIPTIEYARKLDNQKAKFFGPYTSSIAIKGTLRLIRNIFPYCANSKISNKPCFYYHIGKCPGVCFGKIFLPEYRDHYIKKIMQFLDGRNHEILKSLQAEMKYFAAQRNFEKAAGVRDQIFAINRILERQKLVYPKKIDQDVFSIYQDSVAVINLFKIRDGKLIAKENFILENTKEASAAEILGQFLPRFYLESGSWPKEILLPVKVIATAVFSSLRAIAKQSQPEDQIASPARSDDQSGGSSPLRGTPRQDKTKNNVPTRGKKLNLIKLGTQNAKQYLESLSDLPGRQAGKQLLEEARLLASLKELQRVLKLAKLPGRIEAYDISNIQGTSPVGSMVVFDYARPKKQDYRKFKIKAKQTPDDFAMMREVLERRFKNSWPLPELILIDGGKGQLNAAVAAISNFQFPIFKKIPIIGLAKRQEEIFIPKQPKALILQPNSIALFLLQRIRDESHRFAINYHRLLRSKKSLVSRLDEISGLGPGKKRRLLQKFGSAAKIRQAQLSDLAAEVGRKLAETIKARL